MFNLVVSKTMHVESEKHPMEIILQTSKLIHGIKSFCFMRFQTKLFIIHQNSGKLHKNASFKIFCRFCY